MNHKIQDFSSFLPSERPAIGETVKIISGPLKGHVGYVTGTKPKNKDMKERKIIVSVEPTSSYGMYSRRFSIETSRDSLVDINGDPMPKYSTQRELEMMEWRKEQYGRLKNAIEEHGSKPYEYFHYKHDMNHEDVERLESGEECLDFYLDDDTCEELGIGRDWILYGEERSKEHPCGRYMKEYLNEHPEKREIVWKWMQEDGYHTYNWYEDGIREAMYQESYRSFHEEDDFWNSEDFDDTDELDSSNDPGP